VIASRTRSTRHRWCREHGMPTAAVVRSSQATPARRRGHACGGDARTKPSPSALRCPPRRCLAGVDNTGGFNLIIAG
jgi:hypothetical protein